MKKNVSAIVSGAGWIGSFADGLIRELRKRNVPDEAIHSIVVEDGELSIGKIADMLAEIIQRAKNVYTLTINYNRSVEDGVKAGKYDWSNSDITSSHFSSEETGTKEVSIELIHFGRDMVIDEALSELDRMGLRPATIKELLPLGEKHPDLQKEFPIIALASVWRSPFGYRRCACLDGFGSGRGLHLCWVGSRWLDNCRFAAVRNCLYFPVKYGVLFYRLP